MRIAIITKFIFCSVLFFASTIWAGSEANFEGDGAYAGSNGVSTATEAAQINSMMSCTSAVPPTTLSGEALTALKTCQERAGTAGKMCLESLSPKIQAAMAIIGGLASGFSALSANQACEKQNKVLDIAKNAMTAYNLACGGLQLTCESGCATAIKALAAPGIDSGVKAAAMGIVTSCKSTCEGYKMNLAAGAVGLAGVMMKMKTAQSCDKKTEQEIAACERNPLLPECQAPKLNCSLAENSKVVECICLKNPRAPGCPGSSTITDTRNTMQPIVPTGTTLNNGDGGVPTTVGGDTGADVPYGSFGSSGSSGGGLTGGLGASGGGGAAAQKNSADGGKGAAKGLNTNILGGDAGGGGGGGGYRGSSGGDGAEKYRAYMPGGKNDPNRMVAGQPAVSKQVTGAGGEDNWKKVNNRYRDNKPTLIGE